MYQPIDLMNAETVRMVQRGPRAGLVGQLVVLAVLHAAVGLDRAGWFVGVGCGLVTAACLTAGLARRNSNSLGPADLVTLFRATLVGGVAALTVDSLGSGRVSDQLVWTFVCLTVVALVLDGVDGQVARRTSTTSELGARFDMEVDALLILVLSIHVAGSIGPWVLLIGAARYLRLLAAVPLPWMRGEAPARYWGKVVAVTQGVVLTVAAAGVLPATIAGAALVLALGLLAESFGREVWWLWRRHRDDAAQEAAQEAAHESAHESAQAAAQGVARRAARTAARSRRLVGAARDAEGVAA